MSINMLYGHFEIWITLPVMAPLVAGLLAFILGRRSAPWLLFPLVATQVLSLTALSLWLLGDGPQRYAIGGWGAPLGIDLYLDGLSLVLLWLSTIVTGLICLYALSYFHTRDSAASASQAQSTTFWPLCWLLWSGLNASFLAADVFNLFVALEMLTLASVPLVTLSNSAAALKGGLKYLLYALLGSMLYLLGVALLYAGYGTLDIVQLGQAVQPGPLAWAAVALLLIGLLIKTAIFPLHFWLPLAHSSAPAPVSALLSALVVKATLYLLLRLGSELFPGLLTQAAAQVLGALGAAAVILGSVQALRQSRLKMLVAYSTVAQLGYLLLLFPLVVGYPDQGETAGSGVMLQALSHGLAKAALFLAAGNVLLALGHDRIRALGRMGNSLTITLFAFGLAGIAIAGLPPSGGFLGKYLLAQSALDSGQWWWLVLLVVGGLLASAYIFRVLAYAFANVPATSAYDASTQPKITAPLELVPLVLATAAIALGLAGEPTLRLLSIGTPF